MSGVQVPEGPHRSENTKPLNKLRGFLLLLISLIVFIENVDAQNRSRSKKKELIRQYSFTALSVADSKSDSKSKKNKDENVTDVDFEEVDDDKK